LTYYVSIIDLKTEPAKFQDKKVSVVGYLSRGDDPFLYLSMEHANFNDISSGFAIFLGDYSAPDCMNRFVRVTGRFVLDSPNEFAMIEISNIWVTRESDHVLVLCGRPSKSN